MLGNGPAWALRALTLLPMAANAQVLFSTDFEDQDPAQWAARPNGSTNELGFDGWVAIGNGDALALAVDEQSHSGRKALRLTFEHNESYAGASRIQSADHMFMRSYNYFTNANGGDFDHACGMKIARFDATNGSYGFFDIIGTIHGAGGGADDRDFCGINGPGSFSLGYNGGWPALNCMGDDVSAWGSAAPLSSNTWHCLEWEVKMSTPGQPDGELRMWINDTPVLERTGYINRRCAEPINRVLVGGWYSNGCSGQNPCVDPDVPTVRYVDDVVLSAQRIGCGSAPNPAPAPPSNLRIRDS